ncbi:TERF1-interacting nuclear factor 2 isoform X3 [Myxocyprinus asiaticus]|uniref:TERF1-interacting nuclear factor 2 isoform X3 n=1 Tax=Myxocyprinus asiaticus TaxID=70543 RepID=UPI0022225C5C|nr:TERF1-interacting nuclear factor 2 isoform X3 [Myxocyprinus asiaticus]
MKATTHSKDEADTPQPLSALRLLAPPLHLVSAAMWKVMQRRDAVHYGKLEEIITSISETVPGLLSYRHQARLTMGLRALLILEKLRQSDPPDTPHVLQELGKLQAFSFTNRKKKDQKVEEAKRNFHSMVHSLLKNPASRNQFFKEDFQVQYGGHYVASLEKLLWEFLNRLDQLLPPPDLAQTVSWLSAAPAVLEECARSASQPQLLRTLLQHEKCLGHLGSASLLSSTGESILSSLSLPLSGKVLQTIQSESTPKSNTVLSPAFLTPRATRRTAEEALSQVAPVIGSITNEDLQKNVLTKKAAPSVVREFESALERSKNTRTKQSSCSEKEILEKDPEQDCFVGNMLVTVLSQSSDSGEEVEGDNKENRNDRERISESRLPRKNGHREKEGDVEREYSPKRKTQGMGSQEEVDVSALHISCMKRQLRVVIPRLNLSSVNLPVHLNHLSDKEDDTRSPCQANVKDISRVGNSDSMTRKRKCIDLTTTPEKHLVDIINKQTSSASPCIPLVLHCKMATPETLSSITDSTDDDMIVDSEDETIDKVRRKVCNHTYIIKTSK